MLLVRALAKESPIHGKGLFAETFIPAGTPVWQFKPDGDLIYPTIETLPGDEQKLIAWFGYLTDIGWVLCGDDARYMNHSDNPNTKSFELPDSFFGIDRATRDIFPGDELTCDYRQFYTPNPHQPWLADMFSKVA